MKSIVFLSLVILLAFSGLGYSLALLTEAQQANARLAEQLQAAEAGNTAAQQALTEANARIETIQAELGIYKQIVTSLATENAALHQKVRDLEQALATTADASGALTDGHVPICPPTRANGAYNWEPLVQPAAALILAISLGLVRQRTAAAHRSRRNSKHGN
jgi:hypothetical protein